MFLERKGYSMIEWALLLGVIIGVIALGQEVIKNSLERKALLTAHYIMWSSLDRPDFVGDEGPPDEDIEDYDSTRTKTRTEGKTKTIQFEKHSGEIKSVIDPRVSQRNTKSVTTNVAGDMVGEGVAGGEDVEQHFLDQVPVEYKDLH